MIERIRQEISRDPYYAQNYSNDGQRFVAWYLRRVLLRSPTEARQEITDGADDKQVDALVVEDDSRRVVVIQGKFLDAPTVDSEPLREVLSAWTRLKDPEALQRDCNEHLRERLESFRQALDDEYEVHFELLTLGDLTPSASADLEAFAAQLAGDDSLSATLSLVNTPVIEARLTEAEARELPALVHEVQLDPNRTMVASLGGTRAVLTALSLSECLRFPGIVDGRLFRKNVRQFLGPSNKVNKSLRQTIYGDRVGDFFFYHNGITALCRRFELAPDRTKLKLDDVSVVNGCQSLVTIHSASERIRNLSGDSASILFRFYEIPQRELADRISVFTNTQSAVKPRDLRSNDKVLLSIKRSFEAAYRDGFFTTQRGALRPADKDAKKTVDCADLAKALMAWHCQRPNVSYNEKKLFDEHFRTLFKADYDPASILALQEWMNRIENSWANLNLNDALKATKSHSRWHLLYSVSSLVAYASGQGDKVPYPASCLHAAQAYAADILPLAVNCLNKALENANTEAQTAGKVFSPQNWLKKLSSVQSEALVASTMVGMLPGIGAQAMIDKLNVPSDRFGLRWSAE